MIHTLYKACIGNGIRDNQIAASRYKSILVRLTKPRFNHLTAMQFKMKREANVEIKDETNICVSI